MAPGGQRKLHAPLPPLAAHKLLVTVIDLISVAVMSNKLYNYFLKVNTQHQRRLSVTISFVGDIA